MIVVMKMLKNLLLELLPCFAFLAALPVVLAQAPDQQEFISIDCGLSESSNYTDPDTGIFYTSGDGYTDGGVNMAISSLPENYTKQFLSARAFPEGTRNCYTLRPAKGKDYKYLIRASFMYGNYDSKNQLPEFDLYIGEDFWVTVSFEEAFSARQWEIIHTPSTDYVHVCLHKTGQTIPFISALELRPLNTNNMYKTQSGSLNLFARWDLGAETDKRLRYPNDVYDRLWQPIRAVDGSNDLLPKTTSLSTNLTVVTDVFSQIPPAVSRTAATPQNSSDSLYMSWEPRNSSDQFYLCFHFAEVKKLRSNELRQFKIYLNGLIWNTAFSPPYLELHSIWTSDPAIAQTKYELSINSTENSTLPPIINAIEIYEVKKFKNSGTDDDDAAAIFGIKSYYGLTKNWQGDPCAPRALTWVGLSCHYDRNSSRIVSLNLSSSGLTGSIAPDIANLIFVQTLDLSNNNLEGRVPDFMAELANLVVLNLAGNNFNGTIPAKLEEKSRQGLLSFSIDGLPNNASKKKNKVIVPIVGSALAAFLVVLLVFITVCSIRRRKITAIKKVDANVNKNNGALETKTRLITYSEVLKITNDFERILGKGGFGKVYHGFIGDTQVAVKMLNPSSAQGHKEFQAEANVLMSVHHKNLTSLAGYCNEGTNIGIIYEYMANGNLKQHLSELNWEQRLGIALDVAQGLEYLHHGCKPPIIHRDIKPTNILLNEKFQAKLSDFGLSRAFANESGTHVSINTMAGSPGYMDPECHSSYKLTEKSDVYSFGVVLLEIITGRPVLDMNHENRHIIEWVVPFLESGDIRTIVDERFKGNFNINSAWKVVELAMGCVSRPSTRRPTMNDVVIELKQCLAIESNLETEPNSLAWLVVESEYGPLVR